MLEFSCKDAVPRFVSWRAFLLVVVCLCATICPISAAPGETVQGGASPEAGVVADPVDWTVLLSEDFEGEFPGGWVLLGEPTWGRASYRPHTGARSAYAGGGGSGAVDPPGPYPSNVAAWMIYGPFDLSQALEAQLEFYYWADLAPADDILLWGVSPGTSMDFVGQGEAKTSDGWQRILYDLREHYPDCLGEPEVWIALKFESDAAGAAEGVYVDDIVFRVQLRPKTITSIYLPLVVE